MRLISNILRPPPRNFWAGYATDSDGFSNTFDVSDALSWSSAQRQSTWLSERAVY